MGFGIAKVLDWVREGVEYVGDMFSGVAHAAPLQENSSTFSMHSEAPLTSTTYPLGNSARVFAETAPSENAKVAELARQLEKAARSETIGGYFSTIRLISKTDKKIVAQALHRINNAFIVAKLLHPFRESGAGGIYSQILMLLDLYSPTGDETPQRLLRDRVEGIMASIYDNIYMPDVGDKIEKMMVAWGVTCVMLHSPSHRPAPGDYPNYGIVISSVTKDIGRGREIVVARRGLRESGDNDTSSASKVDIERVIADAIDMLSRSQNVDASYFMQLQSLPEQSHEDRAAILRRLARKEPEIAAGTATALGEPEEFAKELLLLEEGNIE